MSDSNSGISTLLSQLKALGEQAPKDEASRQKLYEAAKSLTLTLESPGDTIQRIAYLLSP